jgi:hypothetical protein
VAHHRAQREKIKILFVAADPTATLMLDEEIREITQKILASQHRDTLDIKYTLAARPDDLLQAFNQHKPHIVHFSGHGSEAGEIILLDNNRHAKPVSAAALKALFTTLKDNVRVVVLNACYSRIQAEAITNSIDCTIGMSRSISDEAAIVFAAAFYRAIGFNRSLQEAFEQGMVALQLAGIPEHTTPHLLTKAGIDPAQIHLITSSEHATVNTCNTRLKLTQEALACGDYRSACRDIESLARAAYDDMSLVEQAKLKYLAALANLEGKRPYSQSPSVVQAVEGLMRMAGNLHHIYSYLGILAIFKYDFARAGLRQHKAEADQFMSEARRLLPLKSEDRENIKLLASMQPALYQDYRHYLKM